MRLRICINGMAIEKDVERSGYIEKGSMRKKE
jgi:hypothetical protein